jgi:O-antigen/teichoic acid export membrane protein
VQGSLSTDFLSVCVMFMFFRKKQCYTDLQCKINFNTLLSVLWGLCGTSLILEELFFLLLACLIQYSLLALFLI